LLVILSYLQKKSTANPQKNDIFVEVGEKDLIDRHMFIFIVLFKMSRDFSRHLLPQYKRQLYWNCDCFLIIN